jgi:nitroimidazol reductase NimA-like FMN-containing flavoprotein (pyridoxamine 5'-phosphate oxidase superfamily)
MEIRELSLDECRAVLKTTNLGRLACVRYSQPYIVPICFDFYDDALYCFATIGKKIQWMRTNPRVCVEVDHIADRFNWTTVVVKGTYEELTNAPSHEGARDRASTLLQNRPDWWYPAVGKVTSAGIRRPVVYRIQIESMSGRQALRHPAKISRAVPPSAARAPHWWSHVLRPLRRHSVDLK